MMLGMTVRYYNHSDTAMYMQISSISGLSWTGSTVNLGSLGPGLNAYKNLDNFASRTKPTSAVTEILTVTLRGYSDSGYTNLVYVHSRDVTIVFIKSDDGSWTTDFSDNFNDGTVDGWTAALDEYYVNYSSASCAVATDYVLSNPDSLKLTVHNQGIAFIPSGTCVGEIYKAFTTSSRATVYAILNIRNAIDAGVGGTLDYVRITVNAWNGVPLIYLDTPVLDRWMRIVVPLAISTSVTIRMVTKQYGHNSTQSVNSYLWLDDFKIISKDND
jgi:hypothetical protein